MQEIKAGDKIRFRAGEMHENYPEYYPKAGTVGKVIEVDDGDILVQWPKGSTSGKDRWWVSHPRERLEEAGE